MVAVVTNPAPGKMSGEVQSIFYKHSADGEDYVHQFGPGASMEARKDGTIELRHKGKPLHEDVSGQRFLINPPREKKNMAAKRRHYKSGPKKGQFMPGKARKRTSTKRKAPAKLRRNPTANMPAKPRRRNPPRMGKFSVQKITRDLAQGAGDAALILIGKAGTRVIPSMLPNLPKEGNVGLAVQALTAVVLGMLAGMVVKPAQAKMILAGGLTAPVETLVVAMDVPFLAEALSPTTAAQEVGAYYGYVQPDRQLEAGVDIGAYVQEAADLALGGHDYMLDA